MREAERLAECSGVPVIRTKVMVFVIACALAGMAGSLQAHYMRFSARTYSGSRVAEPRGHERDRRHVEPLRGDAGHGLSGALPELLRGYVELQQIIFGAILFATMAFLPGGLIELGRRLKALRRADAPSAAT